MSAPGVHSSKCGISLIPLIIDNTGKKDAKSRCSRLKKAFGDPLAPIDLSFFSSALNVFTPYNKFLQRSDPLSNKVYPVTEDLVRRLAMRILTPQAIKSGVSLESLNDSTCYLTLEKVFCGFTTRNLIDYPQKSVELSPTIC